MATPIPEPTMRLVMPPVAPAGVEVPPGDYTIVTTKTWRKILAELFANPQLFASVGDVQTWVMKVRE